MVVQPLQFDLIKAETGKRKGMELAAEHRAHALMRARQIGLELGREYTNVHADMVMRRLIAEGIHPSQLGNAAGSIFKGLKWEFTGDWYKSRRISNHCRWIRIWRLK